MPKKTVKKSKHEYRYADSLHRKIKAEAKQLGWTNSEFLVFLAKNYFKALVPKASKKGGKR